MEPKGEIFRKTYEKYLADISTRRLDLLAAKIGAQYEKGGLTIPLFNREYTVSANGIFDASSFRALYDVSVILSKYVLLCPETRPENQGWVRYRNLKDSAPLEGYFSREVEGAISSRFSGRLPELRRAGRWLAGFRPELEVQCDYKVQFNGLPMIPVVLLFNDADDEFPADCSILFETHCEQYLDCECLAMLGRQLYDCLAEYTIQQ